MPAGEANIFKNHNLFKKKTGEIEWYENHKSFIKLNKTREIEACAKALYENAITKVKLHIFNDGFLYPAGTLCGYDSDIFELMFHVIWGEDSLARESEEKYDTSIKELVLMTLYEPALKILAKNYLHDVTAWRAYAYLKTGKLPPAR